MADRRTPVSGFRKLEGRARGSSSSAGPKRLQHVGEPAERHEKSCESEARRFGRYEVLVVSLGVGGVLGARSIRLRKIDQPSPAPLVRDQGRRQRATESIGQRERIGPLMVNPIADETDGADKVPAFHTRAPGPAQWDALGCPVLTRLVVKHHCPVKCLEQMARTPALGRVCATLRRSVRLPAHSRQAAPGRSRCCSRTASSGQRRIIARGLLGRSAWRRYRRLGGAVGAPGHPLLQRLRTSALRPRPSGGELFGARPPRVPAASCWGQR